MRNLSLASFPSTANSECSREQVRDGLCPAGPTVSSPLQLPEAAIPLSANSGREANARTCSIDAGRQTARIPPKVANAVSTGMNRRGIRRFAHGRCRGTEHLRSSAFICVHLRLRILTSLPHEGKAWMPTGACPCAGMTRRAPATLAAIHSTGLGHSGLISMPS
jgi:hypothetical protein